MLSYFKSADFVITDTFHGTVFSMKTNTDFCTIIRDSNKNKLEYLLEKLDQKERMVNSLTDIEKLYNTKCDFRKTNRIIEKERQKTIEYLKKNL